MKRLSEILRQTPVREVLGDGERPVGGLTYDSRAVKPGDCFFAVRGTQADGHAFIPAAGKLVLCLLMLLGRLEIFTVLVLVLPSFWRK